MNVCHNRQHVESACMHAMLRNDSARATVRRMQAPHSSTLTRWRMSPRHMGHEPKHSAQSAHTAV